jgi:invasion protein IalB
MTGVIDHSRPVTVIIMKKERKVIPASLISNVTAGFLLWFLATGQGSMARAEPGPVIEDWVLRCEQEGEFRDRCFIRQTLTLKASGEMLFDIAAGYPLGGDFPLLLLSAPLGMYLPGGITIEVDATGAHRTIVAYCNTEGCHAYYRMTPELFRLFRQGRWLNVTFLDGTRRAHSLQVSLNGFSDAIDALARN